MLAQHRSYGVGEGRTQASWRLADLSTWLLNLAEHTTNLLRRRKDLALDAVELRLDDRQIVAVTARQRKNLARDRSLTAGMGSGISGP